MQNTKPTYKNQMYLYILEIYILEMKLRKIHLQQNQKNKYLGINIIKDMQNLHSENYKTLLKEIKDLNRWKAIPCMFMDWKTYYC